MTDVAMPNDANLDEYLCFAIYAAGHAFNRFYKPLLDTLGLTYPQYLVIKALGQARDGNAGRTVGQIGAQLFLESSTLTPLLKRLEAGGFISRTRDTLDERQVIVRLTARGRDVLARAKALPGCVAEALGRPWPELQALTTEINALRSALGRAQPDVQAIPA